VAVQLAALCIGVKAKKSIKIDSQGVDCGLATKIAGASHEVAFVAVSTGALFEGVEASQNIGGCCLSSCKKGLKEAKRNISVACHHVRKV
jgi:hypothetical protein